MIYSKRMIVIILFIIISFISANEIFTQTLTAQVTVKISEKIAIEIREKLTNFHETIETYINGNAWTNNEIDVEIPIKLEIFFQSGQSSNEDIYGIQFLIADNSDVQYFDRRCKFNYQQGEALVFSDDQWTALTSIIDYYIYLLLGNEMDKFGRLMGTPYFEKAKSVADQANFLDGRYYFGWEQRNELIKQVLSDENKIYREMIDFYFYGIYFLDEDISKARKYCSAAIDIIAEILEQDPEQEQCLKFLSAHHIEIINVFKDNNNNKIFEKLVEIDPDHADAYEAYIN